MNMALFAKQPNISANMKKIAWKQIYSTAKLDGKISSCWAVAADCIYQVLYEPLLSVTQLLLDACSKNLF